MSAPHRFSWLWPACCGAGLLTLPAAAPATAPAADPPATTAADLHRPSPDWRDQVIYFVMTDRFDDGDPSNNDQGHGEFRPGSTAHYQGGDLRGLMRRLDYVQGLGATALWITPPVANQWWDGQAQFSGYHGYWAEHFKEVDRHLGTLDDYRELSRQLHRRGMYLVQDVVLNHTGHFFRITAQNGAAPRQPGAHWQPNTQSRPVTAPRQPPFDQNNPNDPAHAAAQIYHWTPDISDYNQREQELNWQMSGLDDLNTANPVVRRALRDSYGHWIREVGVDAFRVDTAFYVPETLFEDFLHARDPAAPGIAQVARATGRNDFLVFGEGFGIDKPGQTQQSRRLQAYMAPGRMGGMLNFPLYGSLGDVFARGRPPAELAQRLTLLQRIHPRWHWMPSFVDNHDVDRFLAGGHDSGLRQALLALMTLPGIPTLYYGTEQGFREARAAMFAAGVGSGGRDHFDTQASLYRLLAELTQLRRSHRLFSRGMPRVLHAESQGPGAIVWRTDHAGQAALVALNTADHEVLIDAMATGWRSGQPLTPLWGVQGMPAPLHTGPGGRLLLRLPPQAGAVWLADTPSATATATATGPRWSAPSLHVSAGSAGWVQLSGHSPAEAGPLRLVVDGQLGLAATVVPDAQGRWQHPLALGSGDEKPTPHRLVLWRPSDNQTSPPQRLRSQPHWRTLARYSDPAGDDHGPHGRYQPPTEGGYAGGVMDLRDLTVRGNSGGGLQIELELTRLARSWNPANGFDHLALTLFIELPGHSGGLRQMPLQQAELPAGMRWHRRLRLHGWSNALFSSEGASASHEGQPISPGAQLRVDSARRRLLITLPPAALGLSPTLAPAGHSSPHPLQGAKLYLSTWDWDNGYRALAPQAQAHTVGGGHADEPLWMDDTAVVVLR